MEKTWQQLLSPEIAENCTFATTYNKAVELLDKGVTKGVIICIKNVPFEREESIHISAVLPLQERGFYLSTQGNVKNLFLLGESQTIYYTHEFVPHYVRDFNTNVKLEKLGANKISNEDFEISTEKSEHSILLNQQEFIPESGEGVYVVLCLVTSVKSLWRFMTKKLWMYRISNGCCKRSVRIKS